ncbi:MAG: class I tRNA ligase family protein [Candidatus Nomurabacteria bacterium]|nr:class I tRNA ligase family protein [Candidatus Nomurabacteria bacterium]
MPTSVNVLDQWILSRLNQLIEEMTKWMNAYEMALAIAPLDKFIDDLSTWYLRRSRDRMKDGDKDAKQTMYFVLKNLVKVMAPFTPFCSENEWLKLRKENDTESVHLVEWPTVSNIVFDTMLMQKTRNLVSLGLKERQLNNIPVRQPLTKLEVKELGLDAEYIVLIKDELNVKDVKSYGARAE